MQRQVFFPRIGHFSSFHLLKELLTFCTASDDDFAEYFQNIDLICKKLSLIKKSSDWWLLKLKKPAGLN